MGTAGGYTPAGVPECPYAPLMTRAAALALRTAGSLLPNCAVIISDGPVIGTAGNTSATQIELNPVSATELGTAARVHTTFAPSAWVGVYDIDLGASGSITELTDDWGNTAKDIDANASTVHTQFPWHLGSGTVRDNYAEDATLTGWDTQVGFLLNNRVLGSTVNLTGKPGGNLTDNEFTNTSVILGAGGANASMTRCSMRGVAAGTVIVNHTGTSVLTLTDVIQRDGFILVHSGSGNLNISNTTLESHGTAVADINHANTGNGGLTISDSRILANNSANASIDNQGVTGAISISQSELKNVRLIRAAGSAGPVTIGSCQMDSATITIGAANAASTNNFQNIDTRSGSIFNLLGPVASPGRNDFTAGVLMTGAVVNVAATATAGVNMTGGRFNGTFNQNRTAGTSTTALFEADVRGFSTITDNGTTDPGNLSLNRIRMTDSALVIGNIAAKIGAGSILQQSEMVGSTVNLSGLPAATLINRLRVFGGTMTNAGFDGSDLIIDGAFTKTMTAVQNNRLVNKSYDDWL